LRRRDFRMMSRQERSNAPMETLAVFERQAAIRTVAEQRMSECIVTFAGCDNHAGVLQAVQIPEQLAAASRELKEELVVELGPYDRRQLSRFFRIAQLVHAN